MSASFQNVGTGVQRCPGGNHIVKQSDMARSHRNGFGPSFKGLSHIVDSAVPIQMVLRRTQPGSSKQLNAGPAKTPGEAAGHDAYDVDSSLKQASRVGGDTLDEAA